MYSEILFVNFRKGLVVKETLKVMIVDDSAIYRKLLKDLLSEFELIEVVETALNGELALKKLEFTQVNLILLDIQMPVLDGFATLVEVKDKYPHIDVIMISGITKRQTSITLEAIRKGAFDFITKPIQTDLEKNISNLREALFPIMSHFIWKRLGIKIRHAHAQATVPPASEKSDMTIQEQTKHTLSKMLTEYHQPQPHVTSKKPRKIDVIVIGVSTGGPIALNHIIPLLPADLGVPVLIVQHMPPIFTKSLAEHLASKSILNVVEGRFNEVITKNTVYIAPGGVHMIVKRQNDKIKLDFLDTEHVNSCRPSIDVLLDSVREAYKENVLAVILTGMGSDGLNGIRRLKQIRSYTISQSEDSCVVYGMPRVVEEAGLSDEVVHLDFLASRITQLVQNGP
jgi:two-component system chemotaxis response regulator CheB